MSTTIPEADWTPLLDLQANQYDFDSITYALAGFNHGLYLVLLEFDRSLLHLQVRIIYQSPGDTTWYEIYRSLLPIHPPLATDDIRCRINRLPATSEASESLWVVVQVAQTVYTLRSQDGKYFYSPAPEAFQEIRWQHWQHWQNQVFAIPTAESLKLGMDVEACVYRSIDAGLTTWEKVSLPGFGDANNLGLSQMIVFDDSLYVATVNLIEGFQLWKTDLQPNPDGTGYVWQRCLEKGAYRYSLNQQVTSMQVFQNRLLIASGKAPASEDFTFYPPLPELLCLDASGQWDVIIGSLKFTPQGLKVPLSGMGAGLEQVDSRTITLISQGERCYLALWGDNLSSLWQSSDGEVWEAASIASLESLENNQISTISATDSGLVLVLELQPDLITNGVANDATDNGGAIPLTRPFRVLQYQHDA